jgi:hypothetical protein
MKNIEIKGVPAKIRTTDLPNARQKRYSLDLLAVLYDCSFEPNSKSSKQTVQFTVIVITVWIVGWN